MPRGSIFPQPGIFRAATPLASAGRWFDSNLMRWRGGTLQPIGGNAALAGATFDSPGRDVITYHDNHGKHWAIVGTDAKLFAYDFSLQLQHDITPAGVGPLEPPGATLGFGIGNYGAEAYGTAREPEDLGPSDLSPNYGDQWSMDLFGELVFIVPTQDGRLFKWDPTTPATRAALVASAPVGNLGVLVTDERFVVLLGAGGNPRQIAWCDQEDPNTWTPSIANTAGSIPVMTESLMLGGIRCPGGNLIFTGSDVHLLHYVGPPYVYGITKIGANCGPVSRRAFNAAAGLIYWIGKKSFWQYSGSVTVLPSDVGDWFFSALNADFVGRVFAKAVPSFTELWWYFPDSGSTECNRYIAVNYADAGAPWIIGLQSRTAGDTKGAMERPILCGDTSLYVHEFGWLTNGASRVGTVYVETGDIELVPNGEQRFHIRQVMHDYVGDIGAIGFRFFVSEEADGPEWDTGSYPVIDATGRVDVRFSCRGCRMRIEALADTPFAIGRTRVLSRIGGFV